MVEFGEGMNFSTSKLPNRNEYLLGALSLLVGVWFHVEFYVSKPFQQPEDEALGGVLAASAILLQAAEAENEAAEGAEEKASGYVEAKEGASISMGSGRDALEKYIDFCFFFLFEKMRSIEN